MYTLIGRHAHWVAIGLMAAGAAAMVVFGTYVYILLLVLLLFIGPRHPPTRDDTMPLGRFRYVLGWLTLLFLIIGFTPVPITETGNRPRVKPVQPDRPAMTVKANVGHAPAVEMAMLFGAASCCDHGLRESTVIVPCGSQRWSRDATTPRILKPAGHIGLLESHRVDFQDDESLSIFRDASFVQNRRRIPGRVEWTRCPRPKRSRFSSRASAVW